ncbi:hypothetical protein ACIPZF_11080 [Pseudomonas sp. NPDC089752]|uniref:hypothetical protein n=1 Tax=Pseudomonas sp. NPDC089752 TaxID=3364472 RepID=UPI00381252AF
MQAGSEELVQKEIKLNASAQDYEIPGFSRDYAAYLESCDEGAGFFGGLVMAIGAMIALLGLATVVFGPETITYSRLTGPTFIQYIQMYPGPIFSVGGILVASGTHIYAKRAVTREVFMLSRYKLITGDGEDVSGKVQLRYLEGDNFNISIQ